MNKDNEQIFHKSKKISYIHSQDGFISFQNEYGKSVIDGYISKT